MEPISVRALAAIVAGDLQGLGGEQTVSCVSIDSRRASEGAAFFALPGTRTDGHRFVAAALAGGAAAAVVARAWQAPPDLPAGAGLLRVDDPLAALHRLAAWQRDRLAGKVVAVTGTRGKTVVKDALVCALRGRYQAVGSIGSYNSQLGVALSVLDLPQDAEFAVMEAGISAPGEMERLEAILRPDYGLLTNVGMTADYEFANEEEVAREKLKLFAHLPTSGWLLIPASGPDLAPLLAEGPCRVMRAGGPSEELPYISDRAPTKGGTVLQVTFPGGERQSIPVKTASLELLADVELAVGAASLLGVSAEEIARALADYEPSHTQVEVWRSPLGVTLINDSGSADLLSVQDALRYLERARRPRGRSVFVLGGGSGDGARLGEMAAQHGVEVLTLVARPDAREVEEAFLREAEKSKSRRVEESKKLGIGNRESGPDATTLHASQTEDLPGLLGARLGPEDTVLFIGAPSADIEQVARDITGAMAHTRLMVDVRALANNVARFRRLVGPRVKLAGMVKALAYGSALVGLSQELEQLGLDWLGVSAPDEGLLLRRAGIEMPILAILCSAEEARKIVEHRLTPAVHSLDLVAPLAEAARASGEVLGVHLKVDTGMRRLGVMPEQVGELARRVTETGWLRVTGLMTHFGCAENPAQDDLTRAQLARFREVVAEVKGMGYTDLLCHAAATGAAVRFPESHFDMVRIGLGLYGLYPSPAVAQVPNLRLDLAVALVTRIVEVRTYQQGDRIGYGATYEVPHNGFRAGIIPIGYHDGLPWRLSNQGFALVNGHRAPIVGRVSMDSAVLDLSETPAAQVGTEALIYGRHDGYELRPEAVAAEAETIVYELLTRIGPRVQRVFVA